MTVIRPKQDAGDTPVLNTRDTGNTNDQNRPAALVLCVDAGGTSCKAATLSVDGELASSVGGPCNVSTVGLDTTLATITAVVHDALGKHPSTRGQSPAAAFAKVWVGLAGYDRPTLQPIINDALAQFFGLSLNGGLRVSSDIDLLPACLMSEPDIISAIVLVVGTGSVAMSYKRRGKDFERVGRVGGWGRLLGDDGSGYAIGREGIRRTLKGCDAHALRKSTADELDSLSPLSREILRHFQRQNVECTPETLLSHILIRSTIGNTGEDDDASRTKTIASAASVVFTAVEKDAEAKQIVESGASSVAELVRMLVKEQTINAGQCALVLGGSLMGNIMYRETVYGIIQEHCGKFNQQQTRPCGDQSNSQMLPNFRLRHGKVEDAMNISTLGSRVFTHSFSALMPSEDLKIYLSQSYSATSIAAELDDSAVTFIVATEGSAILGFVQLRRDTSERCIDDLDDKIQLQRLYVSENHQGLGLGKQLLLKAEEEAALMGFKNIWLASWELNPNAERLEHDVEGLGDGQISPKVVLQSSVSQCGK
ncbi:unnamed protein product [Clonostachys solani]|uniref:N-acetyl-D-glucosamine kinase n=1 Tax=Clonostachys solani TaxID=160281 RepID=A0A9P0ECN8_9HYPO|nr:unnamed protein product [Clonostachys solani]